MTNCTIIERTAFATRACLGDGRHGGSDTKPLTRRRQLLRHRFHAAPESRRAVRAHAIRHIKRLRLVRHDTSAFFKMRTANDILLAYYAHPTACSEIGWGGPSVGVAMSEWISSSKAKAGDVEDHDGRTSCWRTSGGAARGEWAGTRHVSARRMDSDTPVQRGQCGKLCRVVRAQAAAPWQARIMASRYRPRRTTLLPAAGRFRHR